MYRTRWTIETAFQELEATLNGEINTLGYPKAALFAFCVALVSYNVMSTVKAALRAAHGAETVEEKVSGYYLADEITMTHRGMMIAIPEDEWAGVPRLDPAGDGHGTGGLGQQCAAVSVPQAATRPEETEAGEAEWGKNQTCSNCKDLENSR